MLSRNAIVVIALLIAGIALICFSLYSFPRTLILSQDGKGDMGPLETVSAIPFPLENGTIHVTEPLAHLRIPFSKTVVGKELTLTTDFSLPEADLLEVGMRRGEFWLDYERVPLRHRVLDALAQEKTSRWIILSDNGNTVFLNPSFNNTLSSVAEFKDYPPKEGIIGLYGNASLSCSAEKRCTTAPFRLTDSPEQFRAIYARYIPAGEPQTAFSEMRTFDLTNMYQHSDGSLDLFFFAERRDGGTPRVHISRAEARIQSVMPSLDALKKRAKAVAQRILRRPMTP